MISHRSMKIITAKLKIMDQTPLLIDTLQLIPQQTNPLSLIYSKQVNLVRKVKIADLPFLYRITA